MTHEEANKRMIQACKRTWNEKTCKEIFKALKQEPIDKSAMMYEIYMEGVNMSGEYQGCWVRFKNIEKIVDKYMGIRNDERRSKNSIS